MLEFESELNNLMSILEEGHKEYLEVGDEVIHRGSWREDAPEIIRILNIQKSEEILKIDGKISKIKWKDFRAIDEEYVVDFLEGVENKWAYNYQIDPV